MFIVKINNRFIDRGNNNFVPRQRERRREAERKHRHRLFLNIVCKSLPIKPYMQIQVYCLLSCINYNRPSHPPDKVHLHNRQVTEFGLLKKRDHCWNSSCFLLYKLLRIFQIHAIVCKSLLILVTLFGCIFTWIDSCMHVRLE